MSLVVRILNEYIALYTILDRMLAGEHTNAALRKQFAVGGKAFLDDHITLSKVAYDENPESDYALLRTSPELKKQVARVISAFQVNAYVADMIPGAKKHAGREMDKVSELLNSPERLHMLRLIRNPAMAELAVNQTVRHLMQKQGHGQTLVILDRLNAGDKHKPKVDELDVPTRLKLVRQAIAAPQENEGALSGFFKRAASALVPDMVLKQINDRAEDAYAKAQADLDAALLARVPAIRRDEPKP